MDTILIQLIQSVLTVLPHLIWSFPSRLLYLYIREILFAHVVCTVLVICTTNFILLDYHLAVKYLILWKRKICVVYCNLIQCDWRKQLGEGYEQWGTLHGTWTVVSGDSTARELYLRGIRRRRYGTDDAVWQRRAVNYVGVTTDGCMFSIEARCNEKPGVTQ